jgi:hypothetical protein
VKLSERVLRWMGQQARKPSGLLGQMAGHGMSRGHRSHTAWALGYLDVQPRIVSWILAVAVAWGSS